MAVYELNFTVHILTVLHFAYSSAERSPMLPAGDLMSSDLQVKQYLLNLFLRAVVALKVLMSLGMFANNESRHIMSKNPEPLRFPNLSLTTNIQQTFISRDKSAQ